MKFVVGKTIPLFWIPAHTITFLLPDTYKVIFAASLSIVLGLIRKAGDPSVFFIKGRLSAI
ncbi:hypothetical protein MASR2M69_13370 [Bacteroidota bacterium]